MLVAVRRVGRRTRWVLMVVVEIVVAVPVGMGQRIVTMRVLVMLAHVKPHACGHQECRGDEQRGCAITKDDDRDEDTRKGRQREQCASAGRAETPKR